jgi:hypothetical protein
MFDDVDLLADHYLHGLLSGPARRHFETMLATDPAYPAALAAARRWMLALELARPEGPATDAVTGRAINDVVMIAAEEERQDRRRRKVARYILGGLAAAALLLASLHVRYAGLTASSADLQVLGQDRLLAGSDASLRVRLTDGGAPLADVPVEIALENKAGGRAELAHFQTDDKGTASPRFAIPDWADGEYRLSVVAHTPGSPEHVEHSVHLRRSARVLLATDKPVYRPGQTIRMRTIALRTFDSRPLADQPAVLTVTDPKGNLVFKRAGRASRFGIFAADCELADEVTEGLYRVVSRVGETESALTVDIRPYMLPKFKIEVAFEKSYFKSDEAVAGTVRAVYFHGQPVFGEAVLTLDGANVPPQTVRIERGEGRFQFDNVRVAENTVLGLRVRVTDTANQAQEREIPIVVARQELVVSVVPETGSLTTGLPTRLLIHVQTPDGHPVAAEVTSSAFDKPLVTDDAGVAPFPYTPGESDFQATVSAKATDGRTGFRLVRIPVNLPIDGRVVTTDKAHYAGGESMMVIALGRDGLLFVDFLRGGQTVRTEALTIAKGRGELAFDLPAEWAGEIEIRWYAPGAARRNSTPRRVTVTPARQLEVVGGVRRPRVADGEHRPGEQGHLSLVLHDMAGKPVVGALSLTAVDEAVYAVYAATGRIASTAESIDPAVELPAPAVRSRDDVGSESDAFSLNQTTMPLKIRVIEAAKERGHLRLLLGWAAVLVVGIGYVGYRVWEESPRSAFIALLVAAPVLGTTVLVAGCDDKKTTGGARAYMAPATTGAVAGTRTVDDHPAKAIPAVRTGPADGPAAADLPRVRRYFPETMLWVPELISDENGRVDYDFDFADSITSWRFTASAITAEGRLGGWRQDVPVFQPFFVDVNLPAALTRNDVITVPVVVSNYLKGRQMVRVELPDADWYSRAGEPAREVTLDEGDVKAVEFQVKVTKAGTHRLLVAARAGNFGDAVRRDVTVNPDGRRVEQVVNGALDRPAVVPIELPADAIEGSVRATLKLYPSGFSQLVEGLEGIFEAPHGCFEQTSSTTYPNVLALDYLRRTKKANPEVEARARRFVHLGYQRLLTFEVAGGGFDWYGRGPANKVLTAYGLMEFRDMANVAEVDPAMIRRTRDWLLHQRRSDGSWEPDWDTGHRIDRDFGVLRSTAYIAWAVFQEADRGDAGPTAQFLKSTPPDQIADPYVLALVCNALAAMGENAEPYLLRLEEIRKQSPDGKEAWWTLEPGRRTTFHGAGTSGDVEATALAVLVLAKSRPAVAHAGLRWVTTQRGSHGAWGSTQATVLALKALLANPASADGERRFEVTLGGESVRSWAVPADQGEVMQQVDLTPLVRPGRQTLEVRETTAGGTAYQVAVRHHVPAFARPTADGAFGLTVAVDRDRVPVGELVGVTASLWNRGRETAQMVMVELPIPPGFEVADDLPRLVGDREIDRVEPHADKVVFYIRSMDPEKVREIKYRLRALSAGTVTLPAARMYEYYDPSRYADSEARKIEAVAK